MIVGPIVLEPKIALFFKDGTWQARCDLVTPAGGSSCMWGRDSAPEVAIANAVREAYKGYQTHTDRIKREES
jgi:hypothetical protein